MYLEEFQVKSGTETSLLYMSCFLFSDALNNFELCCVRGKLRSGLFRTKTGPSDYMNAACLPNNYLNKLVSSYPLRCRFAAVNS